MVPLNPKDLRGTNKMLIRKEQPKDYQLIYDFVKEAFKTAKVKDGTEQDFVERLRNSESYVPDLAFVALEAEEIIGHIMLTETVVESENVHNKVLILAPLSVKLSHRNRGIGGELIRVAEQAAIKKGYRLIALVGDPNYYQRYGFTQTKQFDIYSDLAIPEPFVLGKWLTLDKAEYFTGRMIIPN